MGRQGTRGLLALALVGLGAWGSGAHSDEPLTVGGPERPAAVVLPSAFDSDAALPLVLQLHGYGMRNWAMDRYVGGSKLAEQRGLILIRPSGTVDQVGKRFWNATTACCDFDGTGVDDVAYLRGLIDEAVARFPVDTGRIVVVGYSNGAFMAQRMACDAADRVTGVVGLSGSGELAADACQPTQPVAMVLVHSRGDGTVDYGGGVIRGKAYPGIAQVADRWAALNRCSDTPVPRGWRNLLHGLWAETRVHVADRCAPTGPVQLWELEGSPHYDPRMRSPGMLDQALDVVLAADRTP